MKRLALYFKRYYRKGLGAVAVMTAMLSAFVALRGDETDELSVAAPMKAASRTSYPSASLEGDASPQASEAAVKAERVDIFAVRTWEAPPPPPVEAPPPPPPKPPPLPFRFLGRVEEAGQPTAFMLSYGEQILSIVAGNDIDEKYRLERFDGSQLVFLYRPMNATQTLTVGSQS